jgi:PAS domain-containing protein
LNFIDPERIVDVAVEAVGRGEETLAEILDRIPAAVYVTDAEGLVTHFNPACIALAGREPMAHQDRWCVTWRLYDENGEFLPHEYCPMAVAIRHARKVRGVRATAERPDGSRVDFIPFPTPIFGAEGKLTGAVNLLIDLTDPRYIEFLRSQSARCRRLAASVGDARTAEILTRMAADYEEQVRQAVTPN